MVALKHRIQVCGIFLLVGSLLLVGCKPPGTRALLNGKSLIEEGHYADAVAELKTATSLMATNAQAWNYLGLACHKAGMVSDAANAYQQAFKLDHNLAEARFNLGCLRLEQNQLDAARSEFSAFTMLRPKSADGWLKLGETQSRSRDLAGAEKSFNEAIRLVGQSPVALNGLGLIALQRNRPRDAMLFFSNALKSQGDFAPAMLNLAIVQQQHLRDGQAALKTYRNYLALTPAPDNADEVAAIARALEQQLTPATRPPVVASDVQTKPATNPVVAIAQPKLEAPVTVPKPQAPERVVSNPPVQRVTVEPKVARTSNVTTSTVVAAAEPPPLLPDKSKETSKPGFFQRLNPFRQKDETPVSAPSSNMASQPSTPPKVAAPTKPAAPVSPSPTAFPRYKYISPSKPVAGDRVLASVPFVKASQSYQAGKFADAAKDYLQAVQRDPSYFDAQFFFALSAGQSGNLGQSLWAYENALAIQPDSVDARYAFALALRKANYPVDAAKELETILAGNPLNARAHLAAGGIYAEQLKQFDRAREHYLKVLEVDPTNNQASAIRYWLVDHPAQ